MLISATIGMHRSQPIGSRMIFLFAGLPDAGQAVMIDPIVLQPELAFRGLVKPRKTAPGSARKR
ncbi:hypothetical protein [Thalassococcus lentus]|uniref:Uncharacterized protein n=1 Tax=Thalassococcus lentus TaxID=1210524 RepID=A0ABT4XWF2_9RHOB|nr:hypothetical protein [Thalassococcus lentus]MDA7426133.1 hypothetical protein [Thalassococcus lentus]